MANSGALVIFRKQLGDVLLLQPALERLAQQYGYVSIYTHRGFADLLVLMSGDIRLDTGHFLSPCQDVYCLEARPAAMLYAARSIGAQKYLLLSRDIAPWWQRLIFDRYLVVNGSNCYRSELYQRLLCSMDSKFQLPCLNLPPTHWLPSVLPDKYMVIHPTAAWRIKTWPASYWVDLLQKFDSDQAWVLTAGNATWEVALADEIVAGLAGRVKLINVAGRTSLRAYLAILAKAQAVLSVDGSASHLAAAFGRRVLTLFGPTNHIHWHSPTSRNRYLAAVDYVSERKPPVSAIPVDDVLVMAQRLLQEPVDG
jgi:ADP-heptose:LPS heptosyltransferase